MTDELGPFMPGAGRQPPYLAGREREQEVFRAFLTRLGSGKPVPSDIVLYGPRGNGKTVLLGWLETEAGNLEGAGAVETIRLTPAQIPFVAELVAEIAPTSWRERLPIRKAGVPGAIQMDSVPPDRQAAGALPNALAARVTDRALILLLDEAHTLDPEVGRALLNACQQVGADAPLLLVLAGTPDLPDRLNEMQVTFWGRAEILRLGRLDAGAAKAAIRLPLMDEGVTIGDGELDRIAASSHGYPFFLQVWGRVAWKAAAGARTITAKHLSAAEPDFLRARDGYYAERFEELRQAGLLASALELARGFAESPREAAMPAAVMTAAIQRASSGGRTRVAAAEETLRRLGYIWRAGTSWEPGIPSLMEYVAEHAPRALGATESSAAAPLTLDGDD